MEGTWLVNVLLPCEDLPRGDDDNEDDDDEVPGARLPEEGQNCWKAETAGERFMLLEGILVAVVVCRMLLMAIGSALFEKDGMLVGAVAIWAVVVFLSFNSSSSSWVMMVNVEKERERERETE